MWARWIRTSGLECAVVHILSPTAGGRASRYILMPESGAGHNNTIGLTGFFSALGHRQTSAILRLTPRNTAHISAAPTANGAYRNVARNCGEGFCAPSGSRVCPGSRSQDLGPDRALYASFVRKGIRRRRRTSAPVWFQTVRRCFRRR